MPGTVRWSWECPSWARVFTRGLAPSVCEEDLNQKTTENNEQREEIIRLKQEKSSLGDELLCTGKAAGSGGVLQAWDQAACFSAIVCPASLLAPAWVEARSGMHASWDTCIPDQEPGFRSCLCFQSRLLLMLALGDRTG